MVAKDGETSKANEVYTSRRAGKEVFHDLATPIQTNFARGKTTISSTAASTKDSPKKQELQGEVELTARGYGTPYIEDLIYVGYEVTRATGGGEEEWAEFISLF
ncbi:hypothetical protein R1flu_020248 [Riccia fluitans]|uniref:Uncharacterized protein n=1 Tax=Riccia fluitans TaxID=41844 RepID=A0ABD1ZLC4_9MARC